MYGKMWSGSRDGQFRQFHLNFLSQCETMESQEGHSTSEREYVVNNSSFKVANVGKGCFDGFKYSFGTCYPAIIIHPIV